MGRLAQAGRAHRLRNAGDRIVDQRFERLWGDVTRSEPGPTGQHNQVGIGDPEPLAHLTLDIVDLVADDGAANHVGGQAGQGFADFFPAFVNPLASRTLGADGEHTGTKRHACSLEAQRLRAG